MKTHKISGGFVKKYFPELVTLDASGKENVPTLNVEWPETKQELNSLLNAGKYVIEGKEFPIDVAGLCSSAWRGESLSHQGGGTLTEEEKQARKADRADERAVIKEMKEEIAKRKAALQAARAKNGG